MTSYEVDVLPSFCIQSRHWQMEHRASDTTMNGMFYEAYAFNQDIGSWDTVASDEYEGNVSFNQA